MLVLTIYQAGLVNMQRQIPLTGSTSEGDISGEETLINIMPRRTEGAKYPFNLVGTPGLAYFLELPTYPVKGLHEVGDRAFAVTPSKFYEIFKNGTFKELGDVSISGRVVMEDNGYQVVFVDGVNGYYYDFYTREVNEITADGFYPSSGVTYQDGYFIFVRDDTGQFFLSDLLSVIFDPNDYASAEGQPDPLVMPISDHREVYLFGTQTIEVWYNSGASDFPLERNQGAFIEKGCAAKYTITKQNNTLYFVGSDLMVYQMSGYTPIRISSHAIEDDLANIDLSNAFAYAYKEKGSLFYVLTLPARNKTWCYDISTGAWHIRESYQFGRHLSNNSIFFDSKTLVGDFQNGRIYQMVSNYYTDDLEPIVRKFTLPTISQGRERFTLDNFELDITSGVGLTYGQGSDPEIRVYTSKDGGFTYNQNFKVAKMGKKGKYLKRAKVNRFGMGRQITITCEISDPVPIDIGGAWVEINR